MPQRLEDFLAESDMPSNGPMRLDRFLAGGGSPVEQPDRLGEMLHQLGADRSGLIQQADESAADEIAKREQGIGKVTLPDGSIDFRPGVNAPIALSPSDKAAIISAQRQNLHVAGPDQNFGQMAGQVRGASQQAYNQTHNPLVNSFVDVTGAAANAAGNFGAGLVGAVSPNTGQRMQENVQGAYSFDPLSKSSLGGSIIGNTAPLLPSMLAGPEAAAAGLSAEAATTGAMGASAFGNVRNEVQARRMAGEDIPVSEELTSAATQAAVMMLVSRARQGAAQESVASLRNGVTNAVAAYAKNAGLQAGDMMLMQAADNAIKRLSYAPETNPVEGVTEAGVGGAVGGTLMTGAGHLMQASERPVAEPAAKPEQKFAQPQPQATETPEGTRGVESPLTFTDEAQANDAAKSYGGVVQKVEPGFAVFDNDRQVRTFASEAAASQFATDYGGEVRTAPTQYEVRQDAAIKQTKMQPAPEAPAVAEEPAAEPVTPNEPQKTVKGELSRLLTSERGTLAEPETTYSAHDMLDYIKTKNTGELDMEATRQLLGKGEFVQRDVPLEQLGGVRGKGGLQTEKVKQYARMSADTQPPIVVGEDGRPIDGKHRVIAAKARGDATIKAFVPVDSELGRTAAAAATEQKPSIFSKAKELAGSEAGGLNLKAEDITGPGSIYHEEVKPQLQKLAVAGQEIVEGIRKMFPMETGAGDVRAADTVREHFARSRLDQQKAEIAFDEARNGFGKLAQKDQWEFQRRMDANEQQPTKDLQKIADAMYSDTNEGRQRLAGLGIEAANEWNEQWWNRLWKRDPAKAAQFREQVMGPGKIEGRAGFTKARTIENWDDALAKGFVPKYDNPVEHFLATRAERQKFIAGFGAIKELAGTGLVKRHYGTLPDGWVELDPKATGPLKSILPGKGTAIAPEAVARVLKNVVTPSAIGSSKAFRLLMDVNNTLTQSVLGLSAFHVRKVTQELINMNVARAMDAAGHGEIDEAKTALMQAPTSPIKAVRSGADIQKIMLGMKSASPQEAKVVDAMLAGGMSAKGDTVYETQWKRKFTKALSDGGVQGLIRAAGYAPLVANEHVMQKGVFDFVQHAKLYMGYEMAKHALDKLGANPPHEQVRREMAKISDHLDNVLGLMVRDNLFWNRTVRDLATLSTLSVGWNYGSGRALAGGVYDLGKGVGTIVKGGKLSQVDGRRVAYLASTAALTGMIGAVTTYLATGRGPQTLMDYVYPDSGDKDRKGHPVRLNTGFYTSDWFDFMHAPAETIKNKASPLMHAAAAILTNKDYAGTKIRNEDDVWYKQAAQVAKYLAGSGTPLGVRQLVATIQGGGSESKSLTMKLLPFAGIRTAKKNYSMSDAENLTHDLMARHYEVGGRTQAQVDKSNLISKLAADLHNKEPDAGRSFREAVKSGDLNKADADKVNERANRPAGLVGLLKDSSLTADELMQVWDKATPDERKKIQWVVRGRVAGNESLDVETRKQYLKQLVSDVRTPAGATP